MKNFSSKKTWICYLVMIIAGIRIKRKVWWYICPSLRCIPFPATPSYFIMFSFPFLSVFFFYPINFPFFIYYLFACLLILFLQRDSPLFCIVLTSSSPTSTFYSFVHSPPPPPPGLRVLENGHILLLQLTLYIGICSLSFLSTSVICSVRVLRYPWHCNMVIKLMPQVFVSRDAII